MPQVPQGQRQVGRQVIQAQQVSTNAPIEAFGGGAGVTRMGQALSELANETGKAVDRYDKLEADKRIAEAIKRKNSFMNGDDELPETDGGYFSKKGKNATTDIELYKTRMSTSFKELEKDLSNDSQKEYFRKGLQQIELEVDGQMKRHANVEAEKYDTEETSAAIATWRDDAILNYKDITSIMDDKGAVIGKTSKIRQALQKQEELIADFAERQGHARDSDFAKQKILEAKTVTHKGIVERMLANDEDLYAVEYLKQVKESGEVDGRALPDLERMVDAGALRGSSQRMTDEIMGKGVGMGVALEQARAIEDPKLRDEVTSRLKVRFAEAKTVKEEQEENNYNLVADHIEQHKSRDKIPMDQWLALSPSQRSNIDARISNLNSGKLQPTDWEEYTNLRMMAATPETREKFLKMNPMEYRNYLGDKEFKEIVKLREGLRNGDGDTIGKLDGIRTDMQVVKDSLKAVGIDQKKKPELYSQFVTKVDSLVEQWKADNGKKTIPNTELKKIVDHQLVEGTVPETGFLGTFKTKKRLFQVEKGETIEIDVEKLPKDDVADIKRALQKHGKPVTDANIIELYSKVRLKNRKS
jgi:hypothetical protein